MKKNRTRLACTMLPILSLLFFSGCSKSITGLEKSALAADSKAVSESKNSLTPSLVSPLSCAVHCNNIGCVLYGLYCGYVVNYQTSIVTNTDSPYVALSGIMTTAFDSLQVNFATLSTTAGLPSTLQASDIDFLNISKSYDANKTGLAISAPLKSNSNSNTYNYAFTLLSPDGRCYGSPYLIKTSFTLMQYFDLTDGTIFTVNNYRDTTGNITFSDSTGGFVIGKSSRNALYGIPDQAYASNTSGPYLSFTSNYSKPGCGQATIDCITDAYANHGWVSVWAFVQTAFIPATGAAIAAACAAKNCIVAAHPGLYKCF